MLNFADLLTFIHKKRRLDIPQLNNFSSSCKFLKTVVESLILVYSSIRESKKEGIDIAPLHLKMIRQQETEN